MFWGSSEARNFLEDYVAAIKTVPNKLDILFFGMGDPGHLLKTISKVQMLQGDAVQLNIYVVEGNWFI